MSELIPPDELTPERARAIERRREIHEQCVRFYDVLDEIKVIVEKDNAKIDGLRWCRWAVGQIEKLDRSLARRSPPAEAGLDAYWEKVRDGMGK